MQSAIFSAITWKLLYTPESPEIIKLDQSWVTVRSSSWVAIVTCPSIIWWCTDRIYITVTECSKRKYIFEGSSHYQKNLGMANCMSIYRAIFRNINSVSMAICKCHTADLPTQEDPHQLGFPLAQGNVR